MNKDELPYDPNATHLNQLAYYMAIKSAKKGQLLYVLLINNDDNPFRAFDVTITDEYREQTRARLVKETGDIEDAVELSDPTLARHVRFDSRYNWKCNYCSHKTGCDGYLRDEIGLPVAERRWWDTYKGRQSHMEVPKKWVKSKKNN